MAFYAESLWAGGGEHAAVSDLAATDLSMLALVAEVSSCS